jgi:hypothetical protein
LESGSLLFSQASFSKEYASTEVNKFCTVEYVHAGTFVQAGTVTGTPVMSVLVCTYSSYLYSLPVLTSYNTEGVPGLPRGRVNSWSARPTTRYLSITQGPFLFGLLRTVFSVVAYMARLAPYTEYMHTSKSFFDTEACHG